MAEFWDVMVVLVFGAIIIGLILYANDLEDKQPNQDCLRYYAIKYCWENNMSFDHFTSDYGFSCELPTDERITKFGKIKDYLFLDSEIKSCTPTENN